MSTPSKEIDAYIAEFPLETQTLLYFALTPIG